MSATHSWFTAVNSIDSARLAALPAQSLDSSQGTFEKTCFQAAPSQLAFQGCHLGFQFADLLRLRVVCRCRMAFAGGVAIGQQTLGFSLPQVQRATTDTQFFSQLGDVLAMFHPLDGIPLESHRVPI